MLIASPIMAETVTPSAGAPDHGSQCASSRPSSATPGCQRHAQAHLVSLDAGTMASIETDSQPSPVEPVGRFRAGMDRRAQADDGQCVLLPCGEILDEVAARHGAKLCCAERRTGPPQGPEGFDSRLRPPPSGKAANEDKAMNESGITQADGESLVAACHPEAAVPAQPQ